MNFGKADSVVALDFNWSKLKTVNRAAPRVYEIFTKRSSSFFETDQDFNSIYLLIIGSDLKQWQIRISLSIILAMFFPLYTARSLPDRSVVYSTDAKFTRKKRIWG